MARKEPAIGKHMPRKKMPVIDRDNIEIEGKVYGLDEKEKRDSKLAELFKRAVEANRKYEGKYNYDDLLRETTNYFEYENENNTRYSIVGLSLYLGMHKSQLYEWASNLEKYGYRAEIMRWAFQIIERQCYERAESYPTANLAFLRAYHGVVDQSKVDVTSNGKTIGSGEEIASLIAKLGLDK